MTVPLPLRPPRRVVGRPALTRSLTALLVRVHRFSQHRATTAEDRRWAATLVDGLTDTLTAARGGAARPSPSTRPSETT